MTIQATPTGTLNHRLTPGTRRPSRTDRMIHFGNGACRWPLGTLVWLALGAIALLAGPASVPPAEKLLPDDTLAVLTVPDCSKLLSIWRKTPQSRFWKDP